MATPSDSVLPKLSATAINDLLTSISLPKAQSISPLQVTAEFHSIYLLHFSGPLSPSPSLFASSHDHAPATDVNNEKSNANNIALEGGVDLILRVSGHHLPHLKTENEVATMRWIRENTSVPVPAVIAYSSTCNNPLGHEFTLLEKVRGESVDKIYSMLDDEAKRGLVKQLTDMVVEMSTHSWRHVGGLRLEADHGKIVPGPLLDDNFWMRPDIDKFWSKDESIRNLNPIGPFDSHAAYLSACFDVFSYTITNHASLQWLNPLLPRLVALKRILATLSPLSETRLILAHKDLHFANVMCTLPESSMNDSRIAKGCVPQITGLIDWEFAGIVPAHRWDPVRAFLWNGSRDEFAQAEKDRLTKWFTTDLSMNGVTPWWSLQNKEAMKTVDDVWTVVKFVRALVEVCPKGERRDKIESWRDVVDEALKKLGV